MIAALLLAHTLANPDASAAPPAQSSPVPQVQPTVDLSQPAPAATPGVTDEVIKKAVRETVAENPSPTSVVNPNAGALLASDAISTRMSAAFNEAKVPDCLHDDALRLQPARIGPIPVVGLYSLPWLVTAALRGKCN
jgi:hypothetical protein